MSKFLSIEQLVSKMSFDFYGSLSNSYDELYRDEQFRKYAKIVKYLKEGSSVLDLGCGTGLFYEFLTQHLKHFQYLGVDPSEELIEIARKKYPDADSFVVDEAEKISVDFKPTLVVSFTAIHHFSSLDFLKKFSSLIVISVLKKSKRFASISEFLKSNFKVIETLDDDHDTIFVLSANK